jgi:hypothetical protein
MCYTEPQRKGARQEVRILAERKRRSWAKGAVAVGVAALPAYYLVVRRWHARWGATGEEVRRAMPGDDIVVRPRDVTTRAVTIHARPEEVWPWLAQMGYQRGGMYSYDWIDLALGVLDGPSADRILPEFQRLEAGDEIPLGSGPNWPVASVEANRSLVLDIELEQARISWSFELRELGEDQTRLILRIRIRSVWWAQLASFFPVMDFGSFVMTRKMLLGIKQRAEANAGKT